MGIADYILIAVIGCALLLAVRKALKDRRNGKNCSGDCSCCTHNCKFK